MNTVKKFQDLTSKGEAYFLADTSEMCDRLHIAQHLVEVNCVVQV